MLDKAKSRINEVSNAQFQLVDMEDMSQFKSGSIDIVTSCYGFMFATNPEKAFGEVFFRVLKPGGTFITTVWVRLIAMELRKDIMTTVLDGNTPPAPPINPMSMAAPG